MNSNKGFKIAYSPVIGLMKFAACIMVIYNHACALSDEGIIDIVWRTTGGVMTAGGLAVSFFFFVSGCLVTKSLLKNPGFTSYFGKRVVRIFPPLVLVAFISAFVLGPLTTSLQLKDYFSNSDTYLYLLNGIGVLRHDLPGVFINNVYNSTVNGALWTIPVELVCYVFSYLSFKLGILKKRVFILLAIFLFGVYVLDGSLFYIPALAGSFLFAISFYCIGTVACLCSEEIPLKGIYALVVTVILLVSLAIPQLFKLVYGFAMPYISLWLFWGCEKQVDGRLGKIGNITYPLYLCGWPIQQTIVWLHGGRMDYRINFILSSLFAIILGTLVYLVVEELRKSLNKWQLKMR